MLKKRAENKTSAHPVADGPLLQHGVPRHGVPLYRNTPLPVTEAEFTADERAAIEAAREKLAVAEQRFGAEVDRQAQDGRMLLEKTLELTVSRAEMNAARRDLRSLEEVAHRAAQLRRRAS